MQHMQHYIDAAGRFVSSYHGPEDMVTAELAGLRFVMEAPRDIRGVWDMEAGWVYPKGDALSAQSPVSHAQMAAALAMSGIITDAEAIGWVNGVLPAKIIAAIATLPEDHRLIATLRASRPSIVDPSDGIVSMLAAVEGKTETEMVALFQLAASL